MSRKNDLAAEIRKQLIVQSEPELRRELRRELKDMEKFAKTCAAAVFENATGEYESLIEGKLNRTKRGRLPSGRVSAKDPKAEVIEVGRGAMSEHGETEAFQVMAKTALHWGGDLRGGDKE